MVAVLAALIFAFAIPAWVPVIRNHLLWPALRLPVVLFTISEILQFVFLGCVGTGLFTLEYSRKFAAIGIPCCVLSLVSGIRPAKSAGVIVSSSLSLVGWLFFISLH